MARTEKEEKEKERDTDQALQGQKPPPRHVSPRFVEQIIDVFTPEPVSECVVEQTVDVLIVVDSRTPWTSSRKARQRLCVAQPHEEFEEPVSQVMEEESVDILVLWISGRRRACRRLCAASLEEISR